MTLPSIWEQKGSPIGSPKKVHTSFLLTLPSKITGLWSRLGSLLEPKLAPREDHFGALLALKRAPSLWHPSRRLAVPRLPPGCPPGESGHCPSWPGAPWLASSPWRALQALSELWGLWDFVDGLSRFRNTMYINKLPINRTAAIMLIIRRPLWPDV